MTTAITDVLSENTEDRPIQAWRMGMPDVPSTERLMENWTAMHSLFIGADTHLRPVSASPTRVVYSVSAAAIDHIDHNVEFIHFQYGSDADTWVLTDFGEPTSDFSEEQQEMVDWLRNNGRPVLSDKLVTMLQDVQEDPDGPQINIVSLKQMAEFFVEQKDFADPSIGLDRHDIVYAQWRIIGNGVLVIRFPGDEKLLLVAQADAMPLPWPRGSQKYRPAGHQGEAGYLHRGANGRSPEGTRPSCTPLPLIWRTVTLFQA